MVKDKMIRKREIIICVLLVAGLFAIIFTTCDNGDIGNETHIHQWGDWIVTIEPSCETSGEKTRTCLIDSSHTETELIAPLGHNWGEWIIITSATETTDGEQERTCVNCGKKGTRIAYATGNLSDGYFELNGNAFRIIRGGDSIPPNEVYIPAYRLHNDEYLPITEIGRANDSSNGVFSGRSFITSVYIPDTVVSIHGGAFYNCTNLTSISIPKSVTNISNIFYAFYTSSLTSINVNENNTTYASVDGILYNKAKTEVIKSPQGINGHVTIPEGVISFSSYVFDYCKNMTSITLPNSLTSIGWTPFRDCSSLTSITIPEGITSLGISTGDSTFTGCTKLSSISILGVTSIGSGVFDYCNSINSITVGNNLVDVGSFNQGTRIPSFWNYYQTITAGQRSGTYTWNGTTWLKQ